MTRLKLAAVLGLLATSPGIAQSVLAPTPPMGWNSWDSFGTTVTEREVKQNADYVAQNLKSHGWNYIVVDIQWSEQNPKSHGYRPNADLAMDGYGRLIPAPNRFPSSVNGHGFKPLADYIHAKGLQFGIHILRGIPRKAVEANLPVANSQLTAAQIADKQSLCRWNSDMYGVDVSKGGQAYYDSIVQLYASWGVDFIKADDMFTTGAAGDHSSEIAALNRSIKKSGRPIVLSLSPGTQDTSKAGFLQQNAQMWRISDDLWDRWVDVKAQFPRFHRWNFSVRPGHWPDGDMLPLGHIGVRAERGNPRMSLLTHDEQITLMSLWCIARSPLMFGGNLPDNDAFTLSLMTNDEVLAVDQKASVSRQLFAQGDQVAWMAEMPDSSAKYLAVFNTSDSGPEQMEVKWADLSLPTRCNVYDLWTKAGKRSVATGQSFTLKPHQCQFLRISPSE